MRIHDRANGERGKQNTDNRGSLGCMLSLYKRPFPAEKNTGSGNQPADIITGADVLGFFDLADVNPLSKLQRNKPDAETADKDDAEKSHLLQQQIALISPKENYIYSEIEGGLFCVSFWDMGNLFENGLKNLKELSEQLEKEVKELELRLGGWPLKIEAFFTTGVSPVALVIQTDEERLERYSPSDEKKKLKTPQIADGLIPKVLHLLRVIKEPIEPKGEGSKSIGKYLNLVTDSYTIYCLQTVEGARNPKDYMQPINLRLNMRRRQKGIVSSDGFYRALKSAMLEVGAVLRKELLGTKQGRGEEYLEWEAMLSDTCIHGMIGPLIATTGTDDHALELNNAPLCMIQRLYLEGGFLSSNENIPGNGDHMDKYISSLYSIVFSYQDEAKPASSVENPPNVEHGESMLELKEALKRFEYIKAFYPSLYEGVDEAVRNFQRHVRSPAVAWVARVYAPVLVRFLDQVRKESLWRYVSGKRVPHVQDFVEQFERTMMQVMHGNGSDAHAGYYLRQRDYAPRLLIGYTALLNALANALDNSNVGEDGGETHRFLCVAHTELCEAVNSESAVRDSTSPFGYCIKIVLPRGMLYEPPKKAMEFLVHEAAHYIAPRLREDRAEAMCKLLLNELFSQLSANIDMEKGSYRFVQFAELLMPGETNIRSEYKEDKLAKAILLFLMHACGSLEDFLDNGFETYLKDASNYFSEQIDELTNDELKQLANDAESRKQIQYDLVDVKQALTDACGAKPYARHANKALRSSLSRFLMTKNFWKEKAQKFYFSHLRQGYSKKYAGIQEQRFNDALKRMMSNWDRQAISLMSDDEPDPVERCNCMLVDSICDLFAVRVLGVSSQTYLEHHLDDFEEMYKRETDHGDRLGAFRQYMTAYSVRLRILTVLNVCGDNPDDTKWDEWIEDCKEEYRVYFIELKKIYQMYRELVGDSSYQQILEVPYPYNVVLEYVKKVDEKLTSTNIESGKIVFMETKEVMRMKELYKKACETDVEAERDFLGELLLIRKDNIYSN